ncbi:glycoside hydrolase family 2 protein [Saccharibacillus sacchari]|uniref:glycoside hydrolase family 2 protein n=1 Tax=Saccharibacillus sacchari TaxID=456493 RepID=UPI000A023E51|nr:sugar-binding domain-containing protein [Saccharibacillus sacchari]
MSARPQLSLQEPWAFQADLHHEGLDQEWYKHGLPSGESITVPHTWNIQQGLEEFRGTGWYSFDFHASEDWENKLLRLQFDAVYRDATVWVNGQRVGEHFNSGYTTFVLDISHAVHFGANNRIVVSANNEQSQTALPLENSFDWADDGGIIRGVSLLVSGQNAIDYAKLHAEPIFQTEGDSLTAPYGRLSGEIHLWKRPAGVNEAPMRIKVSIADEDGTPISEEWATASSDVFLLQHIRVDHLKLWHFDHPHLYTVDLALFSGDTVLDELSIHVGFREIVAEGSTLLLNREPVRLMGVEWMPGSHPERGMAETAEQLAEMLTIIKEANCVITRFHWQQDGQLLDWCDRNGLLVQEEIPHWQTPHDPDDEWLQTSMQHAREMIHRHYNHPCIYAWGLGNEVNGQSPVTVRYFEKLKSQVHNLDRTRFINYISNTVHENPSTDATGVGDLLMWNDYIGTWHGDLDRPEVIQKITEAHDKPLIVAEYGLCEPAYEGGDARRTQILQDNTIEYRKHPSIAALIYFSLNDYRTQMGEEGEGALRQRVHGSTDLYGIPKPSYETLRELAAPVKLTVEVEKGTTNIKVTLEAAYDIPSYRITGYTLTLTDSLEYHQEQEIPELRPGERYELIIEKIQAKDLLLEIKRPTGFPVIHKPLQAYLNM